MSKSSGVSPRRTPGPPGTAARSAAASRVGVDGAGGDLASRGLADLALADLAEVFALLGEPGRLRLLVALLARGEVCVHELALAAGLSDSSASHALRLLRAHRVVAVRRVARLAYYRLADDHVRQLLETGLAHTGHTQAIHPERLPGGRWR